MIINDNTEGDNLNYFCKNTYYEWHYVNTVTLKWTAMSNSILFSPRTQLASVLGTPSGSQAHHITPWQWIDDFGGTDSRLVTTVKAAAYAGFHPNFAYNGINLPTTVHSGSHP